MATISRRANDLRSPQGRICIDQTFRPKEAEDGTIDLDEPQGLGVRNRTLLSDLKPILGMCSHIARSLKRLVFTFQSLSFLFRSHHSKSEPKNKQQDASHGDTHRKAGPDIGLLLRKLLHAVWHTLGTVGTTNDRERQRKAVYNSLS